MKELKLKAMAKINLGLDVLRKREDGYHDLRMIMQSIYLYDQIRIRQTQKPGIRLSVNLGYLPAGPENLVYKAADLLMKEFGITQGVAIDLQKYIPVAAGLAGGSSDAAAVLIGVNRLFHLGLTLEELQERGVKLGADIPYCLLRGTALAEGIGDVLTPLPKAPDCSVVIAKPVIEEIKDCMKNCGAVNAMMSGSGPTVFGLFDDREKAKQAYVRLRNGSIAREVYLTKFFHNRREQE